MGQENPSVLDNISFPLGITGEELREKFERIGAGNDGLETVKEVIKQSKAALTRIGELKGNLKQVFNKARIGEAHKPDLGATDILQNTDFSTIDGIRSYVDKRHEKFLDDLAHYDVFSFIGGRVLEGIIPIKIEYNDRREHFEGMNFGYRPLASILHEKYDKFHDEGGLKELKETYISYQAEISELQAEYEASLKDMALALEEKVEDRPFADTDKLKRLVEIHNVPLNHKEYQGLIDGSTKYSEAYEAYRNDCQNLQDRLKEEVSELEGPFIDMLHNYLNDFDKKVTAFFGSDFMRSLNEQCINKLAEKKVYDDLHSCIVEMQRLHLAQSGLGSYSYRNTYGNSSTITRQERIKQSAKPKGRRHDSIPYTQFSGM